MENDVELNLSNNESTTNQSWFCLARDYHEPGYRLSTWSVQVPFHPLFLVSQAQVLAIFLYNYFCHLIPCLFIFCAPGYFESLMPQKNYCLIFCLSVRLSRRVNGTSQSLFRNIALKVFFYCTSAKELKKVCWETYFT